MLSRLDDIQILDSLYFADQVTRESTEEERLNIFIKKVNAVIVSDPRILGYLGFMYAQSALSLHTAIEMYARELAISLVKSLNNPEELDRKARLQQILEDFIEEYTDVATMSSTCFTDQSWVTPFRNSILLSSKAADSYKEPISIMAATIPHTIRGDAIIYDRTAVKITIQGTQGSVTVYDKIADPRLFLRKGDLVETAEVSHVGATTFTVSKSTTTTTSKITTGYYNKLVKFMRIKTPTNDDALFLSLLPYIKDRDSSYIRHGMLLYGTAPLYDYDSTAEHTFSNQTIGIYRKLMQLETTCNVPNGVEEYIRAGMSGSVSKLLVTTAFEKSAASSMELLDTRRYR